MKSRNRYTGWGRVPTLALLALTVGLAGCDLEELLTVEDRDVVTPATLEDEEVLPVVVAGAFGDFANAYSGTGGGDSYVSVTALMADEFFSSGTFTTRTATDRRAQFTPASGNTSDAAYNDLHQARRALNDAAERVATINGTDDPQYSEMKALEGYTMVLLAEAFCSAIPLSRVNEAGDFVDGPTLTSFEVLDTAIARFDVAIANGGGHLAALGKARALLAQGDAAGAAAAVADVPTEFVYTIAHSVSGSSNDIFSKQNNGRFSQSDQEGTNGVAFRSAGDPRTPWWEDPLGGFDETIPLYRTFLHNDYGDNVRLTSGVEARLIEAEVALEAGDYPGVTTILNTLRASSPRTDTAGAAIVLPPLPAATNEATAIDQLFEERAYWLFLTGHRLGDLRRLMYEYGRAEDDVYPTGAYHKGATYGDDVVFPIDFDEGNNELFDPEQCVVTDPTILDANG